MATLKAVIILSDKKATGECNIKIQITQKAKSVRIKTKYWVLPDNFKNGKVLEKDLNWKLKNILISEKLSEYERVLLDNDKKISHLEATGIKSLLENGSDDAVTDFYKFTRTRLAELKANGNTGTYIPLNNMLRVVKEWHGKTSLSFSEITPRFLEGLSAHYRKQGHKINSIAVYMRYIRSMFNDAIDEYNVNMASPVILNYPFRKFKIETEETKNRNLNIDVIRQIRDFKAETKREEITKDIFMLQIYLLGINIKDLFYMPPQTDDRIQFTRSKTGRYHDIKVEPEAAAIIEKYKGKKYLLWFADNCKDERVGTHNAHARIKDLYYLDSTVFNKTLNVNLKEIQKRLELKLASPLTTYFARHSFATIMREIGISKDDISLCLGHLSVEKNMKTSGIYIKEDFLKIDLANRKLIDYING